MTDAEELTDLDAPPRSGPALLSDRAFGPYFFGSLISNTGTWLQNIAALLIIFDLTGSAFMAGTVTMVQFGMQLVLSPLSGSLADRFDRRVLMLTGQGLGALSAVTLTILTWVGSSSVVPIIAMVGVAGVGQALTGPAVQAALPGLVPRADLGQAMALHSVTFNLSRAVGPAAGAAMFAAWGPAPTFGVNALSYIIFIVVLARLPFAPHVRRADRSGGVWGGLRYVRAHPELAHWLLAVTVIGFAMEPVNTLSPPFAELLGESTSLVGILVSSFGVGAVVMALFVGRLRFVVGAGRAGLLGMVVLAVGMMGFALSPTAAVAIGCLVLAGAGYLLAISDLLASLQSELPDEVRGRVLALWLMALLGCRPIAAALHGFVSDQVSPRVSTAATAVLAAVVAGVIWRIRRRVR
jgi:MFS family permease